MSDIKQVVLTGAAANDLNPSQTKKRARKPKDATAPNAPNAPNALKEPTGSTPSVAAAVKEPNTAKTYLPAPVELLPKEPVKDAQDAQDAQAGGKAIRVELKKRPSAKRVHLQPKKAEPKATKRPTKKARKITLGIHALHKRMTRAKKMTRKVKEMPLPALRDHLIQKKLIQPTSKAPEAILRQIAADAQIVAGKAL